MGKGFEFVDGTKTDRSTRRAARSHAMKGKNVGKRHQRGSKLDRSQPPDCRKSTILQVPCGPKDCAIRATRPAYGSFGPASRPLLGPSLALPLLLETTPHGLDIIKNYFTSVIEAVYPPVLGLPVAQIKSYWIQMLFLDRTSFHCSLALMATLNAFVFAREDVPLEAIHHLGEAVNLVNQQLNTTEALSDSSISVVNFLIILEMFRGEHLSAQVHVQGLRKMVSLRGGLSRPEIDPTLAMKICKTDIDYAFHYGTPSSFYRDRMAQAAHSMGLSDLTVDLHSVHCRPGPGRIDDSLMRILLDVYQVSHWVNQHYSSLQTGTDVVQEVIVSVGYRLVRFHELGGPQLEGKLEACYHVGLVAFLTTMFLQTGGRRFLRYRLVRRCLRTAVERGLDEEDSDSMLWLLFIGGLSVLEETDDAWLLPRISQVVQHLGIKSWLQLHEFLTRFPWISPIHDEAGKVLWNKVAQV
ncbi:hypothetical protein GQ53DRAFT_521227 [Thozetella sp. PMI_491]|nr:hypothetical protein GQ53DRAFT_521227 [Thozetella sp. PMI_491]